MLTGTLAHERTRKYVLPAFSILIWATYPFNRLNNLVVAAFGLYMIIIGWPFYQLNWRRDLIFLLPLILFGAFALGLLWTEDMGAGWKQLEKRLALVAFPFIFFCARNRLSKEDVQRMVTAFVLVCIGITLYCFAVAAINMIETKSLTVIGFKERTYYYFSYIPLTQPAQIDPIYLSLYINFSILVILLMPIRKYARVSLLIYFVLADILVASKMGLIVMAIVLGLYTLSFIRDRRVAVLTCVLGIATFAGLLKYSKFLRDRFFVSTQFDYEGAYAGEWNSTTQRIAIWTCAVDALKENFPLGYGTADGQLALHGAYVKRKYTRGYEDNYNSHNEYLYTWLDLGVFGFVILMVTLFIPAKRSLMQGHDHLFGYFILICALYFMVEVLLTRRSGLNFFSFFYGLLAVGDYLCPMKPSKNV